MTAKIDGCPDCRQVLLDVDQYFQPGRLSDIASAGRKEEATATKNKQPKTTSSTWITPDGQCAGCACELKGATISLHGMRCPGCGSTFTSKAESSEEAKLLSTKETAQTSPNRLLTEEEQKLHAQVQHALVQEVVSEIQHYLETWVRCNGVTTSTEQCLQGLAVEVLRHCRSAVMTAGDYGLTGPVHAALLHALGNPKLPPGLTETSEKLQRLKYGE